MAKQGRVYLSGEAYFDVRMMPKPFIIHTGNVLTTVLGTAFNIKEDKKQTYHSGYGHPW
jgi:transmembrane sensor